MRFLCGRELSGHQHLRTNTSNGVPSPDVHSILSPMETVWYLGDNCMNVLKLHYIDVCLVPAIGQFSLALKTYGILLRIVQGFKLSTALHSISWEQRTY